MFFRNDLKMRPFVAVITKDLKIGQSLISKAAIVQMVDVKI